MTFDIGEVNNHADLVAKYVELIEIKDSGDSKKLTLDKINRIAELVGIVTRGVYHFVEVEKGSLENLSKECFANKEKQERFVTFAKKTVEEHRKFLNSKKTGMIPAYFSSGKRYKGDLKQGQPHGKGTLNLPNGIRYEGTFEEGEPVQGKLFHQE